MTICLAAGARAETPSPGGEAVAEPRLVPSRTLAVHFRIERRGAAETSLFRLHFTTDGGESWSEYEQTHEAPSPFPFVAPTDGRYGFVVTARDAVGLESPGPQPGTSPHSEVVIDTTPPSVRVIRPYPERLPITTTMEIQWEVEDAHLGPSPVDIAYSLDGEAWTEIWRDLPRLGLRNWLMPFSQGEIRLRFRARDLAGNESVVVTDAAYILSPSELERPTFLIVPEYSRRLTVPVYYRLKTPGGELLTPDKLQRVTVWYRRPGGDWTRGNPDHDLSSPLAFSAPGDGFYDLILFAVSKSGEIVPREIFPNANLAPPPEAFPHGSVLVDTLEPRVRILEPSAGARFQWNTAMRVRFVVRELNLGDADPVIEYSVDGGARWTTYPVPIDLVPLRRDNLAVGELVLHLPLIETKEFLLRVSATDLAGNTGVAETNARTPIVIGNFREDPREVAREFHRKALVLLSQHGRREKREAIEMLRKAIAKWEPFAAAHHDLGAAIEQVHGETMDNERRNVALNHYRRALELAPDGLELRFSVIGALLRLEEGLPVGPRGALHREAKAAFKQIRWEHLLREPDTDEERRKLAEFRRLFIDWKEKYFSAIYEEKLREEELEALERNPGANQDA